MNIPKNMKLALLFVSAVMVFTGCAQKPVENIKVQTSVAAIGKIEANVSVTGILMPIQVSNIISQMSGKVNFVEGEVGDQINQGDLLVRIDTAQANAQLQQANASYKNVQTQSALSKITLDNAEKNLEDMTVLYESGAVAQSQLESAQSAFEAAKLQYNGSQSGGLAQAQAAINLVRAQLENANIVSPITGVIINKNINVGETASMGAMLMTIADTASLKLKGTVHQDFLPYLKTGKSVEIVIDIYPEQTFTGTVGMVGPVSVSTGTYYPVEILLENTNGAIMSGLSAHSTILISGLEQLIVPESAVVDNSGETYLFVIENGTAQKRLVTTGMRGGSKVEILKGLKSGDTVAVSNVNSLFEGMLVDVLEAK